MMRRRGRATKLPALALGALLLAGGGAHPAAPRSPSAAPSAGAGRQVPASAAVGIDAEAFGRPILLSLYSLPSRLFAASEVIPLLDRVRRLAPRRLLLVLTDGDLERALAARAPDPGLVLLDTHGRSFSPWPRDPLTLMRRADGGLLVLVRPNLQPTREEDAFMGQELIADLPEELDRALGRPRWALSPVPFHNGQVLFTRRAAWISLHTLEPAILERLALDRVPVAAFSTPAGIAPYVTAARAEAARLEELYRQPVLFVHPLPGDGSPLGDVELIRRIGGGAGFDLDSLLTLLPGGPAGPAALVADLDLGRHLIEGLGTAELDELAHAYGLALAGPTLGRALLAAQASARAAALDVFLELVAGHLEEAGFAVDRLPLLLVPTSLLAEEGYGNSDFFIGWNNVVVEPAPGGARAEGFASGLAGADRAAVETFRRAGCALALLPPLIDSVRRGGGYRCASNHLHAAAGEAPLVEAPAAVGGEAGEALPLP